MVVIRMARLPTLVAEFIYNNDYTLIIREDIQSSYWPTFYYVADARDALVRIVDDSVPCTEVTSVYSEACDVPYRRLSEQSL